MPRLIDADSPELMERIDNNFGGVTRFAIKSILATTPTIDPESLRPHGRWEFFDFASPTVECSICGALAGWNVAEEYHSDRTNFCSNCGAKMDLEEDK